MRCYIRMIGVIPVASVLQTVCSGQLKLGVTPCSTHLLLGVAPPLLPPILRHAASRPHRRRGSDCVCVSGGRRRYDAETVAVGVTMQ